MVTDAGASQSVLQEMTETGNVDGSGLDRRSVVMMAVVLVRAVHQSTLDLTPVRLPLAAQRLLPAACSGGIKRPVITKKIGTE